MPPFTVGYMPSSFPHVEDDVNMLTIAARRPGSDDFTPVTQFSADQKIQTFDLMLARGFQSQSLPLGMLQQLVHASYVRNKGRRRIHRKYTNPFLAGVVSEVR